jgi:hypothetical protein
MRLTAMAWKRYTVVMSRFARSQPDLFAPAPAAPAAPERPPLEELADLLSALRAADRLPWPDLSTAMAEEYRAIGLGRRAGPEGERLVSAIMDETERLFSAEEREAAEGAPHGGLVDPALPRTSVVCHSVVRSPRRRSLARLRAS